MNTNQPAVSTCKLTFCDELESRSAGRRITRPVCFDSVSPELPPSAELRGSYRIAAYDGGGWQAPFSAAQSSLRVIRDRKGAPGCRSDSDVGTPIRFAPEAGRPERT